MLDFLWNALTSLWNYFFQQNAPMTILIVITGGFSVVFLKGWADRIVLPLLAEKRAQKLMKLQMELVDDYLDELHAVLYMLYREEKIKHIGIAAVDTDLETFTYSLMMWGVHGQIRSEIRKFFRENHLAEKTNAEFHLYKDMRKQHIWTRIEKATNEYWFGGMANPNREELKIIYSDNKDKILSVVDNILEKGREIACGYRKALSEKRKSYSISDYTGLGV